MSKTTWPIKITPPPDGWKEATWYLVNASFALGNPMHHCMYYTGLSTGGGKYPIDPNGSYSGFIPVGTPHSHDDLGWFDAREIHFVREIYVRGEE